MPETVTPPHTARPYGDTATRYLEAGWKGPLPLPAGQKKPVPTGYTGRGGEWPNGPSVYEWAETRPHGNIALRLPENVIGVDIDAYPGKPGAMTFLDMEHFHGKLPATWRTTSRDDGVSGIRLFTIPEGLEWPNEVGPGIEIVRYAHRYAVVWPSIHPDTGNTYKWIGPDGIAHIGTIPSVDDLPALPAGWVEHLTHGRTDTREARTPLDPDTAGGVLELFNEGPPCREVIRALAKRTAELTSPGHGSRHDIMLIGTERLVRLGMEGHAGVRAALTELRDAFTSAVAADRTPLEAANEWDRSLHGALANVGSGTDAHTDPCVDPLAGVIERDATPPQSDAPSAPAPEAHRPGDIATTVATTADNAAWFDQTPQLRHIRTWAQSLGGVSPWAALLVVLTRLSADLPPEVVLPPLGGGPKGSLNLFAGLVGPSNDGKSSVIAGHDETLVPRPAHEDPVTQIAAGTGEGIIAAFVTRNKIGGAWKDERNTYQAFMVIDEIGQLEALMSRSGATIDSTLRTLWNGSTFSNTNADPSRLRKLEAHTYRLALIVGIQPGRGRVLIDEDAQASGLTQRILFATVTDQTLIGTDPTTITIPAPPGRLPRNWHPEIPIDLALLPLNATVQGRSFTRGHQYQVPVPAELTKYLLDEQVRRRLNPNRQATDGHELFNQLRVAALLSILHGGNNVTMHWWEQAAHLIEQSRVARRALLDAESGRSDTEHKARGRGDAVRQIAAGEHRVNLAADKVVALTRNHDKRHENAGCTLRCYMSGITSSLRDYIADGLQLAVEQNRISETTDTAKSGPKAGEVMQRWTIV